MTKSGALKWVLTYCVFIFGCSKSNSETKQLKIQPDDISILGALPKEVPAPFDNAITEEKITLGRFLFFDPILSGSKDVSCATCHHPEFGFAESLELSIGVNGKGLGSKRAFLSPNEIPFVKRNSQSIVNTAFNGIKINEPTDALEAPMFWDLRAKSLENQAFEPIMAFEEMRGHAYKKEAAINEVVKRLKKIKEYQLLFEKAFGKKDAINKENLGKAIATYERTIVANNSRFDQYMNGDKTALSQNEIDGMLLFLKSGCAKCHNGPMFSDFKTHVIGVADNENLKFSDDGFEKKYAFRTPSLRNLRFTFPYMHSGKLKTLQNVLEFYEDLSGGKIANPLVKPAQIDPLVENLNVEFKDISSIVEFINTLNDYKIDKTIPSRVPSGLNVGGNID
ncbi:MAG: cytochrome-c peroxidase [Bacteroidota bacterium]